MATTAQVQPAAVSAADDEDARADAVRHMLAAAACSVSAAIAAAHAIDPAADPIAVFNQVLGDLGRHLHLVRVH